MVLAILRHDQERVVERVRAVSGIGSLFEQEANQLEMTFAHGEVDRRRVVVLAKGQFAAPRNQRLHLVQISIPARLEHVPNIVVFEINRADHSVYSSRIMSAGLAVAARRAGSQHPSSAAAGSSTTARP